MPPSLQVCCRCSFQVVTRSDLARSSPESHSSMLATEGSAMAGLSLEKDASHSLPAIREDISTANADLPPQPPVTTDIAIDGPLSSRSLGTEHREGRPLDAVHGPYNIV